MPKTFFTLIIFFLLSSPPSSFAQFGKWFGPGELSKAHEKLNGVSDCTNCHSSGVPHDKCLVCHTEIKDKLDHNKGFHAKFKTSKCGSCHVEHKGKEHNIVGLNVATFNHANTDWPLTGAHLKVKCDSCHKEKRVDAITKKPTKTITYLGASPACTSCHKDVHQTKYGIECRGCHDTTAWKAPVPTTSAP